MPMVDHIGIAVKDVEETLELWSRAFGLEVSEIEERDDQGIRLAMVMMGNTVIEFVQPTRPDSTVASFLEKRGEGLHHIALTVDDIHDAIDRATEAGIRAVDETPREGAHGTRIAFLHPKDTNGVLVELVQH